MQDDPFPPLIEHLPLGVYRSSLQGRMLRANQALARINGYERVDDLIRCVQDIAQQWYVQPVRREQFAALLARDGQVQDFASEIYRHKTRERIWIRESASLVRDAAGQPLWYEGTVQDITAEYTAQQALASQERRFRALTDRAQVLTLVCDPDGLIRYASRALQTILGRRPESVLGTNLFDLIHPSDLAEARAGLAEVVRRTNVGTESLFRLAHADGSWRSIAALGQNCMDDDAVAGLVLNYRDVTERERAQQAELRLQERFRAAFAASPDCMVISRVADGCYLEVNDTFLELSGFRREELIGRSSLELNIWAEPQSRTAFVAELTGKGRVRHFVAPYQGRGDLRGVVDISSEFIDVEGERCILSISRDITRELAARQALEQSEAFLRLALRAGQQGLWDLWLGSNELTVSAEYAEVLGKEAVPFKVSTDTFLASLHPDDAPRVRRSVIDYLKGHAEEYHIEFRQGHSDGRWIWLRSIGTRVGARVKGEPDHFIGTIADITQSRAADTALREMAARLEQQVADRTLELSQSERRYRNIFEMLPLPILETDWSAVLPLLRQSEEAARANPATWLRQHPDVVKRCRDALRVLRPNPAALRLIGLVQPLGEPGLPSGDLRLFEDDDAFVEDLASVLAGRQRHDRLRRLRGPDGEERHFQVAAVLPPLDGEADAMGLFGMLDVTDLKRLSSELDASLADARRINKDLEAFTYSVSHDLKAPLRGLHGYSQLLLSDYGEQLDDQGRAFLAAILQASRQMAQLTDDLLAYSRLERSAQTLKPLKLHEQISAILADCQPAITQRGMQTTVKLKDLEVLADREGLRLSLRNLIDNAVKFTAGVTAPSLKVSAERLDSAGSTASPHAVVRIAVRDNGIGFDMAFHDRAFQIFQRLHRAEDHPGSGVGLAMVAKAMERMGGRAWAESAPGQGACFFLELPAAD